MSKGRKPKGKHTLTLHFDSKVGIANFIAWYLDGGGEQQSSYYSEGWGKDWIYVKPPDDACPKCEFANEEIGTYLWNNKNKTVHDVACPNCDHRYSVENPYVGT